METKKKDNRGGARPNSGPKKKGPKSFSDKLKADVMKELDARAKQGDTYGKLLVETAFNKAEVHSLRGIAMKLIAEVLVVKETKSVVEKKVEPVVYIPADRPSVIKQEQPAQEAVVH